MNNKQEASKKPIEGLEEESKGPIMKIPTIAEYLSKVDNSTYESLSNFVISDDLLTKSGTAFGKLL